MLGENCRSHRRKCIHYNNSICERCYKLNLECLYVITEKPTLKDKPNIPTSKGKKLFESIWFLEEDILGLQYELSKLKSQPYPVKALPSTSSEKWGLTIKSDNDGIHVETSIQSVQDLSSFLNHVSSTFSFRQSIYREFVFNQTSPGDRFLSVKMDNANAENIFRQFFKNKNTSSSSPSPPFQIQYTSKSDRQRKFEFISMLRSQLVDLFFTCQHYISPIFVYHYHYPFLAANPDSLLSTAIAAFVAYSPCIHIPLPKYPLLSRFQFAEYCRAETREKLQDRLFTPNIYTCVALYFLSFASLFALKGSEARLHSSLCWIMVNQLQHQTKEFNDIELEVWKRLYHAERYLEFNMAMLYDGSKDLSNMTALKSVGVPKPLDKVDDRITVLCFQSLTRLLTNASKIDSEFEIMGLRLMAGVIDVIPSNYIQVLEKSLLELWDSVPPEIQLGHGPYNWMDSVENCQHVAILRFNSSYYIYWMNFQSRLMKPPNKTDLKGTMLGRIDEDRALLIVSICSDALTKIFEQLAAVSPCAIELHWLTMVVDMLNRLSTSLNRAVQKRAKQNAAVLVQVLRTKLSTIGDQSFASETPYISKIRKMISKYMDVNKICNI